MAAARSGARRAFPVLAFLTQVACATGGGAPQDFAGPWSVIIENQTWETRTVHVVTENGARYPLGIVPALATKRLHAPVGFYGTHLQLQASVGGRGTMLRPAIIDPEFSAAFGAARTYVTVPFTHDRSGTLRWLLEPGRPVAMIR